jgi:chromosome segregation ATPase
MFTVLQGQEAENLIKLGQECARVADSIDAATKERRAREPKFVPDADCLASMRRDRNDLGRRMTDASAACESIRPDLAALESGISQIEQAFKALATWPKGRQRDQVEEKFEKSLAKLTHNRDEVASRLERNERMAESCSRLVAKIDADPDWIRLTAMEEGLPLDPRRMKKKGAGEDFGFAGARNSAGL